MITSIKSKGVNEILYIVSNEREKERGGKSCDPKIS